MKHFGLVLVLLATSNLVTVAQSLTTGEGNEMNIFLDLEFNTIPGCWTSTGKSYITDYYQNTKNEDVNIYSLSGEKVASISSPFSKIATKKALYTNSFKNVVRIEEENDYLFYYTNEELGPNYGMNIYCEKDSTGMEGAKAYLYSIEWMPTGSRWVTFTDVIGREAIYDENDVMSDGFYEENKYGKKYPNSYFTFLEDNMLYEIFVVYSDETILDEENANWTEDIDKSNYITNSGKCEYLDITDTNYGSHDAYFSQTLYNEDDKWEYWIEDYDVKQIGSYDKWEDGKYWRIYTYQLVKKMFVLKNSDGERLYEIPIVYREYGQCIEPDLYLLKDEDGYYIAIQEKYIEDGEYIGFLTTYKIDRKTNQITKVSERKNRLDVSGAAAVKGERLKISVDDGKAGESVVISDMSGRVVSTADAKEEGTYINTGGMASGIYNVTLQSKAGKENKRIVIR